ncbi:MAG: sigma-54-dependent Fis family transcriptional regulator [Planctomycetota bacterium]
MITRRFGDFLARLRGAGHGSEKARLAAILDVNRALARAPDLRSLLVQLLDEAVALFGAERGFVVRDIEATRPKIAAARSLDRENVRQPERKVSTSIVGQCLTERSAVFCADAREGDFAAAQSVADLKLRSVLCTPLLAAEQLLGCLYLDHRFQSDAFGADDLPWLQAFADQAAIALHLHQLVDENRALARAAAERSAQLEVQVVEQQRELSALRAESGREVLRHDYPEIVGRSPALVRCLETLERVLGAAYPVLVFGESGTGKELMARAVHRCGARSGGPFVAVNVAAISPGLLESELFGHVRGAFTGAARDRTGLLRESHGGVLFLDEVTEMAPDVQVKLLRFLEDPVVRPVGGEAETRVDLRVVAATNRDPTAAVAEGVLREDLYYRLSVVPIRVPPLRERHGDVIELAGHFLAQAAAARDESPKTLTAACRDALARRAWPGNVRQLRNEVVRLDALADGARIGAELLPEEREAAMPTLDLAALEQRAIQAALEQTGGNKAEAARLLGISRRALYNKLARDG